MVVVNTGNEKQNTLRGKDDVIGKICVGLETHGRLKHLLIEYAELLKNNIQ